MPSPFNISFEIPPLPKLGFGQDLSQDLSGSHQDIPGKEFNFFTYLQSKNQQTVPRQTSPLHTKPNNQSPLRKRHQSPLSPAAAVRPSLSCNNKRQVKHQQKVERAQSIWDLMPQVNEDLLDHNMLKESGIQRFWEDEKLDIRLRDMRISEAGVITELKAKEFNSQFNQTAKAMEFISMRSFTENEVIKQSQRMLQGVPGIIFQLEEKTFTFKLMQNFQIQNYSLTIDAL